MTITTTNIEDRYTGNGAIVQFAVNFQYFDDAEVVVYVAGVLQVNPTHYTLTQSGTAPSAGTCDFVTSPDYTPASGAVIHIFRNTLKTQQADIVQSTVIPTTAIETSLDRAALRAQEQVGVRVGGIEAAFASVGSPSDGTLEAFSTTKVMSITGSNAITHLTPAPPGRELTIIWAAGATFDVTDGSGGYGSFNIGSNVTAHTAGATLSVAADASGIWQQTGREAN